MTTSISTTGSVSSAGIGSGLDVNSIVDGLMKVEQQPLDQLQTKASSIKSTISAYGAIQSAMSTFRDAVAAIALPSTWNATTGTSADPGSVAVSTTSNAAPGNYAVSVQSLAAAQSTVSGTYTSSSALVGAGTLHVDIGSWDSGLTTFTGKTGSSGVDIAVTSSDTLDTLAAKINSAGAGVSASVVNDASGSRLVFTSSTTGTNSAFRVNAADIDGNNTDASGLSGLAFNPAGGTSATTRTQAPANASATINGLPITSQTNNLANVFSGITLSLTKVTSAPVQVTVAQDSAAIKKSVQSFVDAYNGIAKLLGTDLKYDASTKTAGPLQGDSAAVSVQRQLRNMIGAPSTASSAFSSLSQVGIQFQADGTLSINDTKLTSAMANPVELKKLFTNVDTATPANNGIATQLRGLANSMLGKDGALTARVAGLSANLTRNQKDQDAMNDRLAATKARLQAQYSALDTQMASISTLSTYMTQQIANWNKS